MRRHYLVLRQAKAHTCTGNNGSLLQIAVQDLSGSGLTARLHHRDRGNGWNRRNPATPMCRGEGPLSTRLGCSPGLL